MNRVGHQGRGESVWLGLFLHTRLRLRSRRGRGARRRPRATRWRGHVRALRRALERARLGRRLVPPRLLRRRHAARLGEQRRVPDRLDRAVVERPVGRRRPGPRGAGDGGRRGVPRPARRRAGAAVHAAVRPFRRRSRATSRATCPGIRENGGQYTHGAHLVGPGLRRARRRRQGGRAVLDPEPDQPREHPGRASIATRWSRTSCRPTSTPSRPHVGRGGWTWYTGSAGWMYRAGVEWILGLPPARHDAHPRSLHSACLAAASRSTSATTPRGTRSSSRTRTGSSRGVASVEVDGRTLEGEGAGPFPLADDGLTHGVRVVLG